MINYRRALYLFVLFGLLSNIQLDAHTDDDIYDFLKAGKECYSKGLLNEAALEFENVLIIDKTNFQARVWLAQIYIDKKDIVNARKLLTEASMQAPDHPKVKELQKLIGESGMPVKPDLVDPVIAETIGGIASSTKHRKYGLVIPEDKVNEENLEKKLLISTREVFSEKTAVTQKLENSRKESREIDRKFFDESSRNPLSPVFDAYKYQGLNQALDKYFELLMKDPTIASKDDRGLIDEGNKIYSLRYAEDPKDIDNRYYYGILQYINGLYAEADEILKPFRTNPGKYSTSVIPYLNRLDKWREQENMRLAALKYEEEQRLAKEAEAKAKAEAEENDVWAKVKQKGREANKDKNSDLATVDKKDAEALHNDGYKLYKKGKLDEAIAKFNDALSKDGNNPEIHYHLALAWMDKGLAGDIVAYDKAIASYQKVISIAPDSKLAKDANTMINDIRQTKLSLGEMK